MREYRIQEMNLSEIPLREIWEKVPELKIDCYPWDENGYKPQAAARVFHTQDALYIRFSVASEKIKAVYRQINDPVCRDSCVEFFFNPKPGVDERYMNFEINPLGTLLIGIGKDRYDRKLIYDIPLMDLHITSSVQKGEEIDGQESSWSIEYHIPFSFIEGFYGPMEIKPGYIMEGNFYKCGDDTQYPHFGCWNPVISSSPDFHRPECFGRMIIA